MKLYSIPFVAIVICLSLSLNTFAQKGIVKVNYEVKNIPDFKGIYFGNSKLGEIHQDTLGQLKGSFEYTISEPTLILYVLNEDIQRRQMFYLQEGTIDILIDGHEHNVEFKGSKLNEDFLKFTKLRRAVNDIQSPVLQKMYAQKMPSDTTDAYFNAFEDAYETIGYLFALQNPQSFLALKHLNFWLKTDYEDTIKIKKLYSLLDTSLHKYPTYELCTKGVKNLSKKYYYHIGDTIKSTFFKRLNEEEVDLKEIVPQKKLTYLDFWLIGCRGCKIGHEELHKLRSKYEKEVQYVSIISTRDKDKWEEGIEKYDINWLSLLDDSGSYSLISTAFKVNSYPTGILLDEHGVILEMGLHPMKLEKKLKKYIE